LCWRQQFGGYGAKSDDHAVSRCHRLGSDPCAAYWRVCTEGALR
jgi:hypothetical protein